MKKKCNFNLVILGKSGVGKSSLINYFFDKEIAESGSGKPVTGKVFEKYILETNTEITNIYDSWGIEEGKTDDWISYFDIFLEQSKGSEVDKWIHTAIYCLSGESRRIQEFEVNIINKLKEENLEPIIVITKSDLDDKSFYNKVCTEFPNTRIIECCNITQNIGIGRSKRETKRFGLDKLKEEITDASATSFISRFEFVKNDIINKRYSEAPIILEHKVDEIIIQVSLNILGRISKDKIDEINNKVVEQIKLYNEESYNLITNIFFEAVKSYGAFFKKNTLVATSTLGSKIKDGGDDLKSIFLKSSIDQSFMYSFFKARSFISVLLLPFPLSFLLNLLSIYKLGVNKEELKKIIMQKITEYYKQ